MEQDTNVEVDLHELIESDKVGTSLFAAIRQAFELSHEPRGRQEATINETGERRLTSFGKLDAQREDVSEDVRHALWPVHGFLHLTKNLNRGMTCREVRIEHVFNYVSSYILIDLTEHMCPVNGRFPFTHRRFGISLMRDGGVSDYDADASTELMLAIEIEKVCTTFLFGGRLDAFQSPFIKEMEPQKSRLFR